MDNPQTQATLESMDNPQTQATLESMDNPQTQATLESIDNPQTQATLESMDNPQTQATLERRHTTKTNKTHRKPKIWATWIHLKRCARERTHSVAICIGYSINTMVTTIIFFVNL
jgi:hypothetical protein